MIGYEHILYCTDFSANAGEAFPVALEMAEKFGAELHILHVYQEPTDMVEFEDTSKLHTDWIRVAHFVGTEREKKLNRLRDEAAGRISSVTCKMLRGNPQIEIAHYARKVNADLAIMASHGLTGLEHAILGGTAEKIMRKIPCSVLVVKSREAKS